MFINVLRHMFPPKPNNPSLLASPLNPVASVMNPVNVKKLLLSKWTAVKPVDKRKHFLVTKVIKPEAPELVVQWVELQAVHSSLTRRIDWHELRDPALWRIGWV